MSYLSIFLFHKDGDSKECARKYGEALNQTLLTQIYWRSTPNTFYDLEAYAAQKVVTSKLMSAFSL